jgi:hypothetical protein
MKQVSNGLTTGCLYSIEHALVAESLEPNIYTANNKDEELHLIDLMLDTSTSA